MQQETVVGHAHRTLGLSACVRAVCLGLGQDEVGVQAAACCCACSAMPGPQLTGRTASLAPLRQGWLPLRSGRGWNKMLPRSSQPSTLDFTSARTAEPAFVGRLPYSEVLSCSPAQHPVAATQVSCLHQHRCPCPEAALAGRAAGVSLQAWTACFCTPPCSQGPHIFRCRAALGRCSLALLFFKAE